VTGIHLWGSAVKSARINDGHAAGGCRGGLHIFGVVLGAFAILASTGCDDGRPERVTVSGRVLIDGKPLTIGNVKFVPNGARPSSGKLDQDGRFTLTCFDGNDGAVPGLHRVQVSAMEVVDQNKVRWLAPIRYANFRTSGIEIEITEPVDDLTIELSSDEK
jgi:hypothetical protein